MTGGTEAGTGAEINPGAESPPFAARLEALGWLRAMSPGTEGGGSEPHLFETTGGQYMVKVTNNPQGSRVVANELVGGLCLRLLGVRCPGPAVITVSQEVLDDSPGARFNNGTQLASGPAFGSEYWQSDPQGTVSADQIANEADVAGILTADTWIRNHDSRQYRVRAVADHPGRYDAIALDQGHYFGSPAWDVATLHADRTIAIPVPIKPFRPDLMSGLVDILRQFDRDTAGHIVKQVPNEWIDDDERQAMATYLLERAQLAAAALDSQYVTRRSA